ncbi:MAG TPA: Na+/H+ antiporter subunit E [Acidimicrobiales bacterium]|nr:Na+/H+ antiporter subunit E [Acidimicrobiales bacterium]
MRFVASVVGLVVLWLLAWGSLDPAKVLFGIVLAVAILVAMPARHRFTPGLRISPVGVARLIGHLGVSSITASILVAREILTPHRQDRTGQLTYDMEGATPEAVSLLANVIALTPDTMTIDATADPPMIEVHFIRFDDPDKARRSIEHLDSLVRGALKGERTTGAGGAPKRGTGDGPGVAEDAP